MRKVTCDVDIAVVVSLGGDTSFEDFVNECTFEFVDTTGKATIEDSLVSGFNERNGCGYITFTLTVLDDSNDFAEVMTELDYFINDSTGTVEVLETVMTDWRVIDSR